MNNAAQCFGLYDKEKIIGFIAYIHQPSIHKNLKRIHRLVILPDYQGIGLGTKLLNFVGNYLYEKGFDLCIVTSAKNMIFSLRKSEKWRMTAYSKTNKKMLGIKSFGSSARDNYTGRFMYKHLKN